MSVNVRNQKPGQLDAKYMPPVAGNLDIKTMFEKIFGKIFRQPLVPNGNVDIMINGNSVTNDEIYDTILSCLDDNNVNTADEDICRELLSKTLQYYDINTTLLVRECFAVSAGKEKGMDEPSPVCKYTPSTDIIPAANGFISGNMDYTEMFANFAFYTRFNAFGFYFINDTEFDNFKTWFQTQINSISGNLTSDTLALIADFMTCKLDGLTESFRIRNDDCENLDDYCFARLLPSYLMAYAMQTQNQLSGPMPFDLRELVLPKSIVFLNIEKFAHSSPSAIAREIQDINQSIDITSKVNMIPNGKLAKLAPVARTLRKTQAQALNQANNGGPAARAARTAFRKKIPTQKEYLNIITRLLGKMKAERMTQNVYKLTKPSFAKPNRRDPDNYNAQGKITSTKYRPDIHLYLDTSGSISEENYEASVKMAIMLAKKLNVNLYFNTFSHIMSQTTLLNCKDRSLNDIYREFQKVHKVTGGTNFEQIWHFINGNKKREAEFSIMVTDFEWAARPKFIKHPKNLYYIPCANISWYSICREAESFCKSCEHNDPLIRKHILA